MDTGKVYEMLKDFADVARRCGEYEMILDGMKADFYYYCKELEAHRDDPQEVEFWQSKINDIKKYLYDYNRVR